MFFISCLLSDQLVPYGIFDLDFAFVVTGELAAAVFRFHFDLADLVVRTLELTVASRNGVAILDAIFKHADIRIAFLAHAGDDEIGIGDETDTGQLVASKLIQSGNAVNYFFQWFYTSDFFIVPFSRDQKALRELKRKQHYHLFRKSTGNQENYCV